GHHANPLLCPAERTPRKTSYPPFPRIPRHTERDADVIQPDAFCGHRVLLPYVSNRLEPRHWGQDPRLCAWARLASGLPNPYVTSLLTAGARPPRGPGGALKRHGARLHLPWSIWPRGRALVRARSLSRAPPIPATRKPI